MPPQRAGAHVRARMCGHGGGLPPRCAGEGVRPLEVGAGLAPHVPATVRGKPCRASPAPTEMRCRRNVQECMCGRGCAAAGGRCGARPAQGRQGPAAAPRHPVGAGLAPHAPATVRGKPCRASPAPTEARCRREVQERMCRRGCAAAGGRCGTRPARFCHGSRKPCRASPAPTEVGCRRNVQERTCGRGCAALGGRCGARPAQGRQGPAAAPRHPVGAGLAPHAPATVRGKPCRASTAPAEVGCRCNTAIHLPDRSAAGGLVQCVGRFAGNHERLQGGV